MLKRRLAVVTAVVAVLMLAVTPPVEASTTERIDSTVDEPRHTLTVKPFGPYRLIIPTPSKLTSEIKTTTVEPYQPKWANNIYVIRSGDTLTELVPFLGYSANKLASCSGIANPNKLSIGQKLRKPGSCVIPRKAPTQPVTPSAKPAPGIETVIAFAMAQLGDPYVWGGNGPNGWDCSGLVRAAFASAGINTTRTTRTLINEGSAVSRSALTRGDLVFPNSGHVGIYLGGGNIIHAPQTGDVVKISPIWSFYAARRIV